MIVESTDIRALADAESLNPQDCFKCGAGVLYMRTEVAYKLSITGKTKVNCVILATGDLVYAKGPVQPVTVKASVVENE